MKMTVVRVVDEGRRETLRELHFGTDAGGRDAALKQSFDLPGGGSVEVNATHTLLSMNLSLFVLYDNRHAATLMCHWGAVAPYFAVRLPGDAFVEFYFER
jgi:hypothetical protein